MQMWLLFYIGVAILSLALVLPGYWLLRGMGMPRWLAFGSAPIITSSAYYLISQLLNTFSFKASWISVVLPTLAICLGVFIFGTKPWAKPPMHKIGSNLKTKPNNREILIPLLYVLVGLLVTTLFYVRGLDSPESFAQGYDNYAHLRNMRNAIVSGNFALNSLFSLSYPSAFYLYGALVESILRIPLSAASMLDIPVSFCINIAVEVIYAVISPLAIYSFLRSSLGNKTMVLICGSVISCCILTFPYRLGFGAVYPNVLGNALAPSAMAIFIVFVREKGLLKVKSFFLLLLSVYMLAESHPNTIFFCIMILCPFCLSAIKHKAKPKWWKPSSRSFHITASCLFLGIALLFWIACYQSPAFSAIVNFGWTADSTPSQALADVLTLGWSGILIPQPLLIGLVWLGVVRTMIGKSSRWILGSFVIVAVSYYVALCIDGPIRHFIIGFWYNDVCRIDAMYGFVIIPLAAVGLSSTTGCIRKAAALFEIDPRGQTILALFFLAVSTLILVFPSFRMPQSVENITPMGYLLKVTEETNSLANNARNLGYEEIRFLQKVKDIVPENETIINVPADGSAYAPGIAGLSVRSTTFYFIPEDGDIIRLNLRNYTDDPQLVEELRRDNYHYVLLLDQGSGDDQAMHLGGASVHDWEGVTGINDETPGFEIVLADSDMRLYRLTDV